MLELGDPLPARSQRRGLQATALLMALYCVLMLAYLFSLQATLNTHAEDMGIMDQVLWNTTHGHFWRQTICNPVSDVNCLGNVSRWGIHFEPLMLTLVPLYWIVPGVRTLQVVQVLGVAAGALPAYLLASRRLRNAAAGVAFAAYYLVMPALRSAVTSDFHMVTLAAPALVFALWFLYSGNARGVVIASLVAMATKEQVPLDVFMLGLFALAGWGRRYLRLGVGLLGLAVGWAVLALVVIHLNSPLGLSPTAARYAGLAPTVARLPDVFTDPLRRDYLLDLVDNTGGLGVLAPWSLVLALPSAILNALSPYANQYSGGFQYNADIAPFLFLAALEGWRLLQHLLRLVERHLRRIFGQPAPLRVVLASLAVPLALSVLLPTPQTRAIDPNTGTAWPTPTPHTQLAQRFFNEIPATASVSAQGYLVPHLSHRTAIYQFPDGMSDAQYIFVDVTGNAYPAATDEDYVQNVLGLLDSGDFTLVDAQDGYILLQRNPIPGISAPVALPADFCLQSDDTPNGQVFCAAASIP